MTKKERDFQIKLAITGIATAETNWAYYDALNIVMGYASTSHGRFFSICLRGVYIVIICLSEGGLQAKSVCHGGVCKQGALHVESQGSHRQHLSVLGVLCKQKCLSQGFTGKICLSWGRTAEGLITIA